MSTATGDDISVLLFKKRITGINEFFLVYNKYCFIVIIVIGVFVMIDQW